MEPSVATPTLHNATADKDDAGEAVGAFVVELVVVVSAGVLVVAAPGRVMPEAAEYCGEPAQLRTRPRAEAKQRQYVRQLRRCRHCSLKCVSHRVDGTQDHEASRNRVDIMQRAKAV